MKQKLLRAYAAAMTALLSMVPLLLEVQAAALPDTGDQRGLRMPVVILLLVVSAALIVGVLIFTGKKKK